MGVVQESLRDGAESQQMMIHSPSFAYHFIDN